MIIAEKWKKLLCVVPFIWCHSYSTSQCSPDRLISLTWKASLCLTWSCSCCPDPALKGRSHPTAVFHVLFLHCGLCSGRGGTKTLLLRTQLILSSSLLFLAETGLASKNVIKMSCQCDFTQCQSQTAALLCPYSCFSVMLWILIVQNSFSLV